MVTINYDTKNSFHYVQTVIKLEIQYILSDTELKETATYWLIIRVNRVPNVSNTNPTGKKHAKTEKDPSAKRRLKFASCASQTVVMFCCRWCEVPLIWHKCEKYPSALRTYTKGAHP